MKSRCSWAEAVKATTGTLLASVSQMARTCPIRKSKSWNMETATITRKPDFNVSNTV